MFQYIVTNYFKHSESITMKCWKSKKCKATCKVYKNGNINPVLSHRHTCNGYPVVVSSDKTTSDPSSQSILPFNRYERHAKKPKNKEIV